MHIRLIENKEINRQTIRDGSPKVIAKLRDELRRRGLNTDRKLAMDLSERGILTFRYASTIWTYATYNFWLRPHVYTAEEKYMHNLREKKLKGDKGNYLK